MRVRFDMASCRVDQTRALTEHLKQQAVIMFCANSELMPIETWTFLENITAGKHVLDRSFLTGTSDFGKVDPANKIMFLKRSHNVAVWF